MLTDTGPIVAIINRNDPNHAACMEMARNLPRGPLEITWPCFTEAMYLLHRDQGYRAQAALWRFRRDGRLVLLDITPAEADRMATSRCIVLRPAQQHGI